MSLRLQNDEDPAPWDPSEDERKRDLRRSQTQSERPLLLTRRTRGRTDPVSVPLVVGTLVVADYV